MSEMIIECACPFCGKVTYVGCTFEQYKEYMLNPAALVQDIFPEKDTTERETIVSGMCKECQDNFFSEEEEENCDGECDVCPDTDCPSNVNFMGDCNGVCELCDINDDCPTSTVE